MNDISSTEIDCAKPFTFDLSTINRTFLGVITIHTLVSYSWVLTINKFSSKSLGIRILFSPRLLDNATYTLKKDGFPSTKM